MKPSGIKNELARLAATKGLNLEAAERARYLSPEQQAECDRALAAIEQLKSRQAAEVARVSQKLNRLREHLVSKKRGDEFARFRFCSDRYAGDGYPLSGYQQEGFQPGGMYAQPEDDREAFIDSKLKAEGL